MRRALLHVLVFHMPKLAIPPENVRKTTGNYNLFVTDWPKTDRYGRNLIPYRANRIWNLLHHEIKNSGNLDSFKLKIKALPRMPLYFMKNTFTKSRVFIRSKFIS